MKKALNLLLVVSIVLVFCVDFAVAKHGKSKCSKRKGAVKTHLAERLAGDDANGVGSGDVVGRVHLNTFCFEVDAETTEPMLKVKVSLKKGEPKTTYDIWVKVDGEPTFIGDLMTNKKGKGHYHSTVGDINGALINVQVVLEPTESNVAPEFATATKEVPVKEDCVILDDDPTSAIEGRIAAVDGQVIAGVNADVLMDGVVVDTALAGADGKFTMDLDANSEFVLKFTTAGYADQVLPVKTADDGETVTLDITMIARGETQSFTAEDDASLRGEDGASVTVTANSFVDVDGQPVLGDIHLTITPVDVSRAASLPAFPGEFAGVLEGDTTDTPIVSYGTVEYEFTQDGQPVQLAPGQTADIQIPVYFTTHQDGTPIAEGDIIPLWVLDEATGIWVQEGTGTIITDEDSPTGFVMTATVSHFSWWNCDVSMNAAQAIVTVFGSDYGTALVKAYTTADIGWRPTTVETVASVGEPTGPLYIPSNGEVCFWAEVNYTNGSSATTFEECVNASPSSLVTVDLIAPAEGPLTIMTLPVDTGGVLEIAGYIDSPVDPAKLRPTTTETTVSYNIVSGALPAGVTLKTVNATRAEITGIPTDAGNFSVLIEGVDADGNTDSVTLNYTISSDSPPPLLDSNIEITFQSGLADTQTFDLSGYNIGGTATTWALTYDLELEQSPPPSWLSIDPDTGILSASADIPICVNWEGSVTATNVSGSSVTELFVWDINCS